MAVTQKQIAQYLEMSQPQVAQALNGHPGVSAVTRQKVLEAAKLLGYDANSNARARQMAAIRYGKTIKTGTLAVLMGDFLEGMPLQTLPFFREILVGLHGEVEAHDSHIATFYLSRSSKLPRSILGGNVDGVISLYSSTIERELAEVRLDVPVVLLGGASSNCHLRPDDFKGAYEATKHLLDLGHRRIAFFGDLEQEFQIFAHEERLRGYRTALHEAKISLDEDLLFNLKDPSQHDGYEAMRQALKQGSPFTAAVCLNDLAALGVIQAATERGLSVPGNLSVTGFDGLKWDGQSSHLTSVFFDREAMGRKAVARIYGDSRPDADSQELLSVELQVNQTTAPLQS